MRVVLDTNVLISACWTPNGLEAQLIALAISKTLHACVSSAVAAEYRDVLLRPKFANLRDRATKLLADLEHAATYVEPSEKIQAASDEDDNRFLECAIAAEAEFLITGNLRHYPAEWASTKIVNARKFLELTSRL